MPNAPERPRKAVPRGPAPLSGRTAHRLLADLLRRADSGDAQAAETLLRLRAEAERRRRAAAAGASRTTTP
jgi:hypothetical protein